MKYFQNKLIQGTVLLTAAGFITRVIGFAYRIFLADFLGSANLGIYQLIFPVYGICFTIYGAGIQTAISQLVAANQGKSARKHPKDITIFSVGLSLSLILSFSLFLLVELFAQPISKYFLLEPACAPYLKILALLFPFCGTSACINGYFYGKKEAHVPAISQIIEQIARVLFVILICLCFSLNSKQACRMAVFGIVIGEITACIYNCYKLFDAKNAAKNAKQLSHTLQNKEKKRNYSILSNLLFLVITLTSTKLVLSILHSVEAIFIPAALQKFGYSANEALGIYGILTGIALPFILFPSTLTNSFAVMLLPAIAQAESEKNPKKIQKLVTISAKYSLYIGYLFACLFLLFGKEFGTILFHQKSAGLYITLLSFICPFLYLSTTFTSVINGLGKTQITFFVTVISLSLKIYFLIFLVPSYGIQAYLFGTLLAQILMTIFEGFYLRKYVYLPINELLLIPGGILIFTGFLSYTLFHLLPILPLIRLILCCGILVGSYLLLMLLTKCIKINEIIRKST